MPSLPPAVTAPAPPLAASAGVARLYQLRNNELIWFKSGVNSPAAVALVGILKRAQIEGLANAPNLAAQAQLAIARAQGGAPAETAEADRLLSAMWAQYVQKLQAPVSGVVYGDPYLIPKVDTPERILLQAAHAPSLEQHVRSVSAVNPIYAQLRDAAWSQAQAPGAALDPRVQVNLERTRILPSKGRYVVVDIASQQLMMFVDGRLEDSMKVIVGRKAYQTPMIASTMHYATFNPYWNVPTDVVKRVTAPEVVKRGLSYMKSSRYEVASDWTDQATVLPADGVDWKAVAAGKEEVRIRQLPGSSNMMGAIKFPFANDNGIYLHDTPSKTLFGNKNRALSLGCVRVEDAQRFARWLFQREPTAPSESPEQHVKLPKPVSIYLTYLTARADGGQLSFADDVYGLDPPAGAQVASRQ